MIRIAVVIPYFQRTAGILQRALASIAAQNTGPDLAIDILVVDDASPQAAQAECVNLVLPSHITLTLLDRPNGGPGAARNTGLDNLRRDTDFIAFLDSDDLWHSDHLNRALLALGEAGDFYFCDHQPWGQEASYFSGLCDEFSGASSNGLPTEYVEVDGLLRVHAHSQPGIYVFERPAALIAIIRRYLAHTSTVVYRFRTFPDTRFNTDLRSAGEDYLFSIELANRANMVCYSTSVNVSRGVGINLYMGSISWNDVNNTKLVLDNLRCFKRALDIINPIPPAIQAIRTRIKSYRAEFVYVWCRRLILFQHADLSVLVAACKEDQLIVIYTPIILLRAVVRKALRLPVIVQN